MDLLASIIDRAARHGVPLPGDLAPNLASYLNLLLRWNRTLNLTGLADPGAAIDRLVLEPVLAARFLPAGVVRLLDIGSGGGSPAIPMALSAPHLSLTMVESKARKCAFLREAIRHLTLADAVVEPVRIEELSLEPGYQRAFDAASVRAVRLTPAILDTTAALLRGNGVLLSFHQAQQREDEQPSFFPLVKIRTVNLVAGSALTIAGHHVRR